MKCQYCNGTGEHINDANRMTTCEFCGGTGVIKPLTHEEWFCKLSTEEKARFLACEFTIACDDYAYSNNKETWSEKYWLEWLKKEHK